MFKIYSDKAKIFQCLKAKIQFILEMLLGKGNGQAEAACRVVCLRTVQLCPSTHTFKLRNRSQKIKNI